MFDFHIKSDDGELEKLAQGAVHMDDLTTFYSEKDGAIIVCAQKNLGGTLRNVCWLCGELFHQGDRQMMGVEVHWGGTRIYLHAKCEAAKPKASLYYKNLRGMQVRRNIAKLSEATERLAKAAAEGAKKIIG
jgi:hypothetical protein